MDPTRPPESYPSRTWAAGVVAVLLGLGAIAIALVVVRSGPFDLDRFAVPKELVLLVAGALALAVVVARVERIELGVAELCLALFVGWSLLSSLFAVNHWLAARAFGVTAAGAAWYLAARFAANRGIRAGLIAGLSIAIVAAAGSGLLQAYGWTWELLADTRAPGGTLGNRNFMAHLTVLGLPLGWWLATRARGRLAGAAVLAMVAIVAAAVVLSRSRASWVGAAAALIAMTVLAALGRPLGARMSRSRLLAFGAAIGIGVALALVLPNRLDWRSPSPYRDSLRDVLNYRAGSGRGRMIQYRNSLRLVVADPVFGAGPGNWMVRYPQVTTPNDPSYDGNDPIPTNPWPSSDWVAMVAERGPIGTLAWLGFLGSLLVVGFRRRREPEQGPAAIAAVGVMAAAATEGLFDAVLLLAPATAVTMAALGALLPGTRPLAVVELRGRRLRLLAATTMISAALIGRQAGELAAIAITGRFATVASLEAAARFDPGNHRIMLLLAQRAPCPVAGKYAIRAARLLPFHRYPPRLAARCGRKVP